MDVSVVVPTFNRARRLTTLLEDLCGQRVGTLGYEILIVDNGSVDNTALVVQDYAARDPRVHYVCERSPGASCARNAGIAAATAPILAFIDDDVRPRADWVASVYRAFAEEPELDCLGGRIEPRWPVDPPAWLTSAHWGPLALQMGRGSSSHIDRDHAAACLVTANFACRASVFRELGGFSPDFHRDEDREFNLRLWRAGKRGKYVDAVVTYADVQPERLDKAYHRAWHHVTGQSHARMRYRDSITRDGVLDDSMPRRGRQVWGVPGFLYREALTHLAGYIGNVCSGRFEQAFADECRLRYLSSYFAERWRDMRSPTARSRRCGVVS